mmetsp:Transcript_14902/g.31597  ORF Transcript_14902/g.31597 Transcript_14902/m.31597 type:complete len:170 (+) Transcript_14902:149-658(+)
MNNTMNHTIHHTMKRNESFVSCSSTECDSDGNSSVEKVVRFNPSARLRTYQTDDDEDPLLTWYTRAEYQQFRADRTTDATRIIGQSANDLRDEDCFWGLENVIVGQLRNNVRKTRTRVWKAVLKEQKCQSMECRQNPQDIARAACIHTQWAEKTARKKALFYSQELFKV